MRANERARLGPMTRAELWRSRPKSGVNVLACVPYHDRSIGADWLRPRELSGPNAVPPHLEMKRLVVSPESPGGFALVPAGRSQRLPDRPPLSLGSGPAGHLLQGELGRRKGRDVSGRRLDAAARGKGQEVHRFDEIGAQEDGPANRVSELADVARPMIPEAHLDRFLRDPTDRAPELPRGLSHKPRAQVDDVFDPLSQRGHEDDEFGQPVIEILSESARSNLSVQGNVGGRNDPD